METTLDIAEELDTDWIVDAYANAVPPRIIAKKLLVYVYDDDAINAEREAFKDFMRETIEKDGLIFANQIEAWELYTFDWNDWIGKKDYHNFGEPDPYLHLMWLEDQRAELNRQVRPDNVDPETGGQL